MNKQSLLIAALSSLALTAVGVGSSDSQTFLDRCEAIQGTEDLSALEGIASNPRDPCAPVALTRIAQLTNSQNPLASTEPQGRPY